MCYLHIPVYLLFIIFFLLHFENMTNKKLLKVFVTVVDAHLFETVLLKSFKAKDVKHTNGYVFAFSLL